MTLLPKSHEEFSQVEYWNTFFEKRGKKSFEWYGEYPELSEILHKYIKIQDDILIVGCGNSTLSMSLFDVGYRKITNIDLSQIVIKQMQDINKSTRPDLLYEQMDATRMTYPNEKFNVIIDKGTLDALMPDAKETTVVNIDRYFKEIKRVLRNTGRYICISLLQEHILRKLLSYFPEEEFMFRIVRCHEAEAKASSEDGSSIPVFAVVATKFTKLTQKILEIVLVDSAPERLSSKDEMINAVQTAQQSALVFNSLHKRGVSDIGEISLDLYRPGDKKPRYTVYVLDQPRARKDRTYATFIVPQGKETDWLFCTKEGRQQVLKSCQRDRLAIVTLRRDHVFENMETVKTELEHCVRNLAPAGLRDNTSVPFLSLGTDVGVRKICYEGKSEMSGEFVVEEVEDEGFEFRRLIFLSNPYVIQSEARLKDAKSRRGKTKKVIDPGFLACKHHVYMTAGVSAAIKFDEISEIMIIGLGGGGLCTFIHHCFPKVQITVVEIDQAMFKIAKEYFGLVVDERMNMQIADGIQFIEDTAAQKKKYKAILFDVDSKDTTIGISCPPKQFLQTSILNAVAESLDENGLFILNLVSRDQTLKQKAKDDLKCVFKFISCYPLQDEVNEIIICSVNEIDQKHFENTLRSAAISVKEQASKRKLILDPNAFDISSLLETLTVQS